MNSVFSEQIFADKLSKLNGTQQCIETLSHWVIFHRSKAELVVTTWDKQFHKSEVSHKVLLLYLANDILQHSKRKGNEFVTEFWKVLPAALKDLAQNGDERGKKAVTRLVDIWEERRIFGSRAKSLKDLMLGEELPPPLELNKKRPRPVRIAKRDSRSIRTKLTIGSAAEKIVSAFHSVLSEHPSEELDMSNCQSAVHRVRKMEKDFDIACADAKNPKRKDLAKELEGEENCLKECIKKLKSVEATRAALVSQLKEALNEQESLLENVRTQMQVAQAQAEDAGNMRRQLCDENYVSNGKGGQTPRKTTAATAAEVADKLLAASSSSQLIMTSVLSSLAAEEAKNAGFILSSSAPTTEAAAFMPTAPMTTTATSYQSMALPQQQTQAAQPSSQQQYPPLLSTRPATTYLQQPPYGFNNFAPAMPATHPPAPHLVGPVSLTQAQSLPLIQQPPPPAAPSFRPIQPPGGMLYYATNLYPSR